MMGTIAIIAALPGELKPLVSPANGPRWQRLKANKGTVLWEFTPPGSNARWIAGCSGMGAERALVAMAEVERYARADAICSIGWAGALDKAISAASVWHVAEVIDTQTGERFATAQQALGKTDAWPVLATATRVADSIEKARLAATYGARLVDMEAATLARIAQGRGIPFFCLKAVSDVADAKLPDLNPFIRQNGQLRMVPFLAHIAVRPRSWPGMMRLGRFSDLAAKHLAAAVQLWLDETLSGHKPPKIASVELPQGEE
jgi:adenosylhomocysteine nucleosidase